MWIIHGLLFKLFYFVMNLFYNRLNAIQKYDRNLQQMC